MTPKINRLDLESYVHPPQIVNIAYEPAPRYTAAQVPGSHALLEAIRSYDISDDPYIVELRELTDSGDHRASRRLAKVLLKRNTWCLEQLTNLERRAQFIQMQLGASCSEWYIHECCRKFLESASTEALILPDVSEREKTHLAAILKKIVSHSQHFAASDYGSLPSITDKVAKLIAALEENRSPSTRILIFVEQRAVVSALSQVLKTHCGGRLASYTFGTFVGTSTSDKRTIGLSDLADTKQQQLDLDGFRCGSINAMIATNVLEEGIDISACNVVMCFDPPKNLVAFVQRRGRARQQHSKYIMFEQAGGVNNTHSRFAHLEEEMKQAYMDETRVGPADAIEDMEAINSRKYRVESTGALLDLDNAKAHLYHFCQISMSQTNKYVDPTPEFFTERDQTSRPWQATVTLPSFVHYDLRTAKGSLRWCGEEAAIKDAAFEAYIALHRGGLVNDNLLPLTRDYGPDPGQVHVDQPSIVQVSERKSTVRRLCELAVQKDVRWHATVVNVRNGDDVMVSMDLYLPLAVGSVLNFVLFWNEHKQNTVDVQPADSVATRDLTSVDTELARQVTDIVLRSVYQTRMRADRGALPFLLSARQLLHVRDDFHTTTTAEEYFNTEHLLDHCGLIREKGQIGRAYFLPKFIPSDGTMEATLEVTTFPKRKDFLHRVPESNKTAAYTAKQTLTASSCTVDNLPSSYALFAAFVPSILHRIDIALLAQELQSTTLGHLAINDNALVVEAICSPAAQEGCDYNRLEFLGDTILKFCSVLQVMANHLTWPEGYLMLEKSRVVSNNVLAKAVQEAGLDKYIVVKPFTGSKWRPPYVDEVLGSHEGDTRELSSKVLADVVEALVGACFVDGGLDKAYDCIQTLLPAEGWMSQCTNIAKIVCEAENSRPVELSLVEKLVGYKFDHPQLLLEALTHASFPQSSHSSSSYERLEFLGDAVLDLIIVPKLYAHPRKLRHWDLHRVRDALVNGNYLAYCSMNYSITEERYDVADGQTGLAVHESSHAVHLHDFIRAGAQLMRDKRQYLSTSETAHAAVKHALASDNEYPWPEICALDAPKFLSDVVESTLGALYLDSRGDLSVCEAFIDKLGILKDMNRILDEHVETAYPKEQLGILADRKAVDYMTSCGTVDGRNAYECTVKVGEDEIAAVGGYGSREEAELRAARQATRLLEVKLGAEGGTRKRKLDVVVTDRTDAA